MDFTPLEKDILKWIADHCDNAAIAEQVSNLKAVNRRFTGAGSYTELLVVGEHPAVNVRTSPAEPHIDSPELDEFGAGCVLFFEDGRASLLELYANGSVFPEQLVSWTLL